MRSLSISRTSQFRNHPSRSEIRRIERPRAEAGITLSAVQAEFKREFLLGDELAAYIMEPGVDWPTPDAERVDQLAHACKASWDHYRNS